MTEVSPQQIEALLLKQTDVEHAVVANDGNHYELTIVSDEFVDQPKVRRQLWVYKLLNKHIVSGDLHAVHMNTYTKDEWEKHLG
ncbi:MAG: BolA/IbaG family iron-sulfur metabolism protein [Gammaproteobacteria bacterium]|nr:BolA/IbaG family iron-sulfur metabolism protein [Gammaproteobacteria bacterium]